uniref:Ig-like domain-containing protein n=1 Tax=Lates calcarifer TaxID=8187 RepID=A0A4W6BQQ7_LATCA
MSEKFSSPWTIPSTSSTPIPSFSINILGYLVEDLSCGQYLSAFILRCEYLSLYISLFVSTEPPDSVSISFRDHSGPLLEGHQYTLQCEVHNVAPVENLIVTFYRGQTAVGQLQSNNTEKKPVTEIFTLSINTRKEHDRVQYWCEAKLQLGPEGPQPPPVVTSEKFSATVNSTPASGTTPSTICFQNYNMIISHPSPLLSAFILLCSCLSLYISLFVSTEPPDNVSISFRNHSGPLLEGHQYTLQCEVHNVAPVENLTVTFYRGQTALGQLHNTGKKPVTEIFTLNINTSKEDDGVQYWCEPKLELGLKRPQPPPVVTSAKFSAIVNSNPASGNTPSTSSTLIPSFSMCFMLLFLSLVLVHSQLVKGSFEPLFSYIHICLVFVFYLVCKPAA